MANLRKSSLDALSPDTRNGNEGTMRGQYMLEESVQQCGLGRSILADRHGNIIAGNKTFEAAGAAGLQKVVVVETTGDELVVVQRMDLDLYQDEPARRLALYDNRTAEVGIAYDMTQLIADMADGADYSSMFFKEEFARLAGDQGLTVDPALLAQFAAAPPLLTGGNPSPGPHNPLQVTGQPNGSNSAVGGGSVGPYAPGAVSWEANAGGKPLGKGQEQIVAVELAVPEVQVAVTLDAAGALCVVVSNGPDIIHSWSRGLASVPVAPIAPAPQVKQAAP